MAVAGATSNGDMSSVQNATKHNVIVGGRRSNIGEEVDHVTSDQTAKTAIEFDSPLIEVQLFLLPWPTMVVSGVHFQPHLFYILVLSFVNSLSGSATTDW